MTLIALVSALLFNIFGVGSILDGLGWLSLKCRRRGYSYLVVGAALLFAAGFIVRSVCD